MSLQFPPVKKVRTFKRRVLHLTFEGLAADVAAVGAAVLMLAGLVAEKSSLLCEALLTDFTAEGTLTSVCPVVFVQTGWKGNTDERHLLQ